MSQHTVSRSRRELALNVGAVAGLICIVIAVASMLFGIKPLVFRSGSMSPDIPTGSLAIADTVPASDIRVGDVVSVDNEAGTRITHRVVAVEQFGADRVSLTLKGDANRAADPTPYVVAEADRVITSVPFVGYVAAWLSSKTAIFLGGILAGALLMLAFGPIRRPGDTTPETNSSEEPADDEAQYQEADRA
ncbi:signal peptidase I [Gordonia sp. (in: high G+C Gram-positive bacteria)]|uniref:signal peptidase I n=1 Tax=Gordonia sp. (in: high G+C Gram-positive bacteria) TaxID=84139 RepID=UPI003C79641F